MNFGEALEALKEGKKVSRSGWNGKGMWLALVKPDDDEFPPVGFGGWVAAYSVVGMPDTPCLPWIGMKTADNCFVPWLASQTDVLSEDWGVME